MMLASLIRASLDGAIVAALVWATVKCLPWLSPATRTALWWCAAAKFVLALLWVSPIELRVLPTSGGLSEIATRVSQRVASRVVEPVPSRVADRVPSRVAAKIGLRGAVPARSGEGSSNSDAPSRAGDAGVDWPLLLTALWSAGLATVLILDLRRYRRTRAALRQSSSAGEDIAALTASLRHRWVCVARRRCACPATSPRRSSPAFFDRRSCCRRTAPRRSPRPNSAWLCVTSCHTSSARICGSA